ncbi:MAG: patatin-like phospholipase family protein [Actinomycetota bacterium]|nr:patatin-like phospholipase family protein [Actinomycetota bacterium]MDQ2959269.1 patatin-like phospholipase family protein [Actinomycetota bacterium]
MTGEQPRTAFVLGGGGVLGATQVGMLRALIEQGIRPDLVLGTSVGALNGALVAADPSLAAVETLTELWGELAASEVFSGSVFGRARTLLTHGTHLHSSDGLRELAQSHLAVQRIEELPVRFQCVAASIEKATAHWFVDGPIAPAVLASCAVPGLLPPVVIDGEHFMDGGLVHSIPVGRAVALGAQRIYVLHVGRVEQPLRPPRWPWQVGLVAFEIARRHRFVEEMDALPDRTEVHVLPSGDPDTPLVSLRYRDASRVAARIELGYAASLAYLSRTPSSG